MWYYIQFYNKTVLEVTAMHRPSNSLRILPALILLTDRSFFSSLRCLTDKYDSRSPHWLRNSRHRAWSKSTTRCDIRKKMANRIRAGKKRAAKRAAECLERIGTKEYTR